MSYRTTMYAWDTKWGVTASEKLVIIKLAELSNDVGMGVFPSNQYIADKTELSVESIKRITRKLEKLTIFHKEKRRGQKTQTGYTNAYIFVAYRTSMGMNPTAYKESDWQKVPELRGVTCDTPSGQGVLPATPQGVLPATPIIEDINKSKQLIEDSGGDVLGDSPPTLEPSIKPARAELHAAVTAYREVFSRHMRKDQRSLVEHITDIPLWKEAMNFVRGRGTNPNNINYMLDVYKNPAKFGISISKESNESESDVVDEQTARLLLGDDEYERLVST